MIRVSASPVATNLSSSRVVGLPSSALWEWEWEWVWVWVWVWAVQDSGWHHQWSWLTKLQGVIMVVMDLVTEVLGMVGQEDVLEVEGGTGDRVGEVGGEGDVD